MRDLVSRSETGWHEGKKGGVVPVTRVKRLQANKYSPTYMSIASQVTNNNKTGKQTILKEGNYEKVETGKQSETNEVKLKFKEKENDN